LSVGLIALPAVVEAAVETVRPAALDKRVEIHVDLDETLWVRGDAKRLGQVAGNLLVNAVKFTPAGGRVDVRLARRGDFAELSIEDTGTGIDEAFLPHVFDRFRQGDASVTREHGGLGLGLAIARHIVELHGGSISARNRSDVPGSAFTVALPAAVAA
jgi:signal transduction histidine kinase